MNKHEFMRLEFGPCANVCANCRHFKGSYLRRSVAKCEVYGRTSSEATDWSGSWSACGAFNRDVKERNMYEVLVMRKKARRRDDVCAGQIGFEMKEEEG